MLLALRSLRAAGAEYFFDLPRMAALNLFWFVTALPFLLVAYGLWFWAVTEASLQQLVLNVWILPIVVLTLALAGPGTAAIYHVTNRLANGELLEIGRFWPAVRKYFWRGWGMACVDVGALILLVINVVFYWSLEGIGVKLLSLVFAYLLLMWFAIQGYVFSFLVELDQSIWLAIRNSLFMAIDNLGVTIGLTLVNALFVFTANPATAALALPFFLMAIASNVHNKVIVDAVSRYRSQGRVFSDKDAGRDADRDPA
jgi:uncharacterized membrane protein YesL